LGELVIYKNGTYKYGTMLGALVLMESSDGRTSYFGSVIFFVYACENIDFWGAQVITPFRVLLPPDKLTLKAISVKYTC
jgi:hypothetical protein